MAFMRIKGHVYYVTAHLLLSHNRTQVTPQAENDLFNALNNIRQSMEEVKDILENLKPLLVGQQFVSVHFKMGIDSVFLALTILLQSNGNKDSPYNTGYGL